MWKCEGLQLHHCHCFSGMCMRPKGYRHQGGTFVCDHQSAAIWRDNQLGTASASIRCNSAVQRVEWRNGGVTTALNVALLVPMSRRTSRTGLVDALSAHYGSPGRLADNRRQFEKMTRSAGEDPSIFAMALETLAVKAFGDMGQTARLQLIRDRFIVGHASCELRRYLDSVPSETPIRDVVDRCRVWESHADPDPLGRSVIRVRIRFIRLMWLMTRTR